MRRRTTNTQAASELLFQHNTLASSFKDRTPGQPTQSGFRLAASTQSPYCRTRREHLEISWTEVPALTIAANASQSIAISGHEQEDWSLSFCAYGNGNSEREARDRLKEMDLVRSGATVFLNAPAVYGMPQAGANLIVKAPADAPITVHASFSSVSAQNLNGPVRITAMHARATVLNTTGKVDAAGFVVDYAGSEGTVLLSAETEINLKITSPKFNGSLMAWAQGPVRVRVPAVFRSPFRVIVSRPKNFICRTEFAASMHVERNGALYVFTYPGDGSTPPENLHLRSEHASVIIDTGN